MNLDENWQEGTFGQAARIDFVEIGFGHQGAELLSVKGGKMGVLAVFEGFYGCLGSKQVFKDPKVHDKET